jgi:PAS domain S-box-containing protein
LRFLTKYCVFGNIFFKSANPIIIIPVYIYVFTLRVTPNSPCSLYHVYKNWMDRELQRLEAVKRFKELDPAIERDLNDIVDLASQICNTPVALITLLDDDKQWFKAAKGTDVTETPRELSFCNHTILQQSVLIVPDLLEDERYANNPMVTSDPHVRFYAGAPLYSKDGYGVGSLCVVDFAVRELTELQANTLKMLSKQVVNLMELNWSLKALEKQNKQNEVHQKHIEESEVKLKAVFDSSNELHLLIGQNLELMAFNKAAAEYFHNIHKEWLQIGDRFMHYVDPKVKHHLTKYLEISLKGKTIKHDFLLRAGTPHECWREVKLVPVKNNAGQIVGVALNSSDITKRKKQEKQIAVQNDALTRIAIIQSHELRRPVASLLGIIDLMKLEQIDFGYFNMMELTVNELDEKIRIIVKDSEDTIENHLAIVA